MQLVEVPGSRSLKERAGITVKFYGVAAPVKRICTSWEECKPHVHGVKGAMYRSFATREEAEAYVNNPPARTVKQPKQSQKKSAKTSDGSEDKGETVETSKKSRKVKKPSKDPAEKPENAMEEDTKVEAKIAKGKVRKGTKKNQPDNDEPAEPARKRQRKEKARDTGGLFSVSVVIFASSACLYRIEIATPAWSMQEKPPKAADKPSSLPEVSPEAVPKLYRDRDFGSLPPKHSNARYLNWRKKLDCRQRFAIFAYAALNVDAQILLQLVCRASLLQCYCMQRPHFVTRHSVSFEICCNYVGSQADNAAHRGNGRFACAKIGAGPLCVSAMGSSTRPSAAFWRRVASHPAKESTHPQYPLLFKPSLCSA
ncbi:unnamed protein product [Symbiodinium sp. CCMP2456]|nr:unnamed protein product [Symbiodinium sp. CCMP2456]